MIRVKKNRKCGYAKCNKIMDNPTRVQVYCDVQCRIDHHNSLKKTKKPRISEIRICKLEGCDITFEVSSTRAKQVYCCPKHKDAGRSNNNNIYRIHRNKDSIVDDFGNIDPYYLTRGKIHEF